MKDFILIKPDKVKKVSDIIDLPDDSQIKPRPSGKVLEVGPLVTDVVPGDMVHYEVFDWTRAPDDCIIIREGEILAKESCQDFKDYING